MSYVSEEVRAQVAALEVREKALAARVKRLAPVWLGLAGGTSAASLLARFLGPDQQPSSIDIPTKVLEFFSANVPGGGGLPYETAVGSLTNMFSSMQPVLTGLAIIGMVVGGGLAIFKGEPSRAVPPVIAGMLVIGSMTITSSLFGGSGASEVSPRVSFVEAVEKHRYNVVLQQLQGVKLDATTAGMYVLAQVAIAEGQTEKPTHINADLARAIVAAPVGPGFTPRGQALYAIEHAAYGSPKSPAAVAYQDERQARQGWARMGTIILGALSMAAGGVALSFLALRRTLAQRVRRIQGLLSPDNKPMEAELKR